MLEMRLSQEYPPLPANLWLIIDIPKILRYPKADHPNLEKAKKTFFDKIKKAFRLYVEVISFYDKLSKFYFSNEKNFSQKDWIALFDQKENEKYLQDSIKEWMDTFSIDIEDWFTKFQDLFTTKLTQVQKEEILNLIPFECLTDGKFRTFSNDFCQLAERGFLVHKNKNYSKFSLKEIKQKLISYNTNFFYFLNNMEFDGLLATTSDIFQDKQRFFIKFQHIITKDDIDKVGNIIQELRIVWEKDEIPLIKIKYASSSQKKMINDLVIYPICLFYNQRGIYLTGFGPKPGDNYLGYYNYRLDHFQEWEKNKYILIVNWNDDDLDIHPNLPSKKEELQEQKSDDIYNKLQNALGVDLHREIKTMLLRFPEVFHEFYIESTKRHDTFKRLNVQNLTNFWQKFDRRLTKTNTTLTNNEREFINKVIKKYPNDAYYMMDYRHGKEGGNDVEADVIMRLRSWGHNVEILAPEDLRERMKKDSEKLWDIYKNDK